MDELGKIKQAERRIRDEWDRILYALAAVQATKLSDNALYILCAANPEYKTEHALQ